MKKGHITTKSKTLSRYSGMSIKITSFGPTQAALDQVARDLLRLTRVKKQLRNSRHRLLSIVPVEAGTELKSSRTPAPPRRFRATIYDYTNNRTLLVDGRLAQPRKVETTESASQPLPTREEFEEAVRILTRDKELGPSIREQRLQPYPPMPPLLGEQLPDGRTERTIAVGLLPAKGEHHHEIVGVNMSRRTIVRYENHAPPTAQAHNPICGIPYANQGAAYAAAGQVWITVKQGSTTLWKFLAVRPGASSGTNGSGVELRFLDYRGKRVLYRAHVPILNVKYDPTPSRPQGACGPFRDWQREEGMIQATGTDVAPGFRLCPTPAQTILDTGSDTGNFLGTAIYVQGQEVVLVCEMEAAWYRYISEWRLHANGTICPRFGFSAVSSSCVCNVHHHHAYWRLDFDIRTAGNNRVREFNNPPLVGSSNWHNKNYEIRRPRDPARNRKWRVENAVTGQGYDIIPGADDGVATASPDWPFPRGDVWILRYRRSEIDDGVLATGPPYEAGLDGWVNGESIQKTDVVIWYGAHFTHDVTHELPGSHGHIVGPILKPVNW
jgi:Copper amine oxidase, enzyme domain